MVVRIVALILMLLMSLEAVASLKRKAEDDESDRLKITKTKISSIIFSESNMYSNEAPRSERIFIIDLSKDKWKEKDNLDRRKFQIYNTIENIFEENMFIRLSEYCSGGTPRRISGVFGKLISGKLKTSIIIECQYRPESLSPCFEDTGWDVDPKIIRPIKRKWHIRQEKSDPEGFVMIPCKELSWRWVDLTIHSINMWMNSYKELRAPHAKFCRQLYQNIRRKGLENSLIRICVVVNKYSHYSFNIIYNNEKQKKESQKFLLNFKKEISEKFKFKT